MKKEALLSKMAELRVGIDGLQRENAELRVEITRLQQENNRLKHNETALLEQLRRAHEAIEHLKAQAANRAGRMPE